MPPHLAALKPPTFSNKRGAQAKSLCQRRPPSDVAEERTHGTPHSHKVGREDEKEESGLMMIDPVLHVFCVGTSSATIVAELAYAESPVAHKKTCAQKSAGAGYTSNPDSAESEQRSGLAGAPVNSLKLASSRQCRKTISALLARISDFSAPRGGATNF
jgi:hypothetical protein